MSALLPCPNCHQLLRPPIRGSRQARLRCPACKHEITGGELLFSVSQAWLVIDDPGGEDIFVAYQPKHDAHSAPIANNDAHYELLPEGVNPAARAAGTHHNDSETHPSNNPPEHSIDWEKFKPISHEEFQRRKREASSPLALLFQTVLGGMIAIPIALLLIWHVLGKDVGGAAPVVARYVPWIVPEHLRPIEELANNTDFDRAQSNLRSVPFASQPADDQMTGPADETVLQPPPEDLVTKAIEEQKANRDPLNEYTQSVDFVETMKSAWLANRNQDSAMKSLYAEQFYLALVGLAEKLSNLSPKDVRIGSAREQTIATCRSILEEPSLVQIIRNAGRERWLRGALQDEGIAFIADLMAAQVEGDYWTVPLLGWSDDESKPITIRIPKAIATNVTESEYFVLGIGDWKASTIEAVIAEKVTQP